jgi:NitT/TauT family transport system substrate-binding protein
MPRAWSGNYWRTPPALKLYDSGSRRAAASRRIDNRWRPGAEHRYAYQEENGMTTHRFGSKPLAGRRTVLGQTLAAAIVAGSPLLPMAVATAQAQAPEKKKVTIAVGGKPALYYLPLSIAEQLGYFKDEGLDVEIVDFAGGSKSLQAVVGGSADVVAGAYEHTINLQSRKQYFTSFALIGRAPQISVGIAKARLAKYKSPKDLKGMKIGVSAPGSSTNMVANYVMAQGGLTPKDASFIGVGTGSGAVAAVRSGQIDAISNTDPIMTMLERSGDIKVVATTRTLKGTQEIFGGPMPAGSLYAPESYVKQNPNTVQALTNAIVRANLWLQRAGPSDIMKTVPESYLLGDSAVYLAAYNNVKDALSPDGLNSEAGAKTTLKALQSFNEKLDPAQIDLPRTWTNDFVKKALAKYRK